MIFWLYAKHHWPPSAYVNMSPNERRVLQAFYLQEQKELEEALPGTVIMYKGKPTDNGWRTDPKTKVNDPHYDIVYEIFHTGVYIPFEESAPLPGDVPADWIVEDADIEEQTLNP